MKLRHFGENDEQQSEGVEKEMIRLVLGEKAAGGREENQRGHLVNGNGKITRHGR